MVLQSGVVEQEARALVRAHGWRTRQVVVDHIVTAIRHGDIAAAKNWDALGDAVDRLLIAEPVRGYRGSVPLSAVTADVSASSSTPFRPNASLSI